MFIIHHNKTYSTRLFRMADNVTDAKAQYHVLAIPIAIDKGIHVCLLVSKFGRGHRKILCVPLAGTAQ